MITKLQTQSFIEEVRQLIYRKDLLSSYYKNDNDIKINTHFSLKDRTRIVIEGQSAKTSIENLCIREGISSSVFYQWTQEFLKNKNSNSKMNSVLIKELTEEEKFKIVIEGKTGETSIAEICKRESITQDKFLEWSQTFLELRKNRLQSLKRNNAAYQKNKELINIVSKTKEIFNYFENYIDFTNEKLQIILKSNSLKSNSLKFDRVGKIPHLISLQKINDVRYINKYFEKINSKLSIGGIFIGCLETFSARRKRKKMNKIPIIGSLFFTFEFVVKRIIPKLSFTKKYYFDITKGNDRFLSKAEGLGRLVSSGFKIMDYKNINGLLYFVVKKVKEPSFDLNPSYGPVYKMPRIGKNGEIIKVFKFRTMHPYSEYLQDYVLNANGYANSGKPADDFRIPYWGKFMRKCWLDELPQLINVLKGDMKLVGIRPVSERYFQDIPLEMQKLRLTQKPGCIPPYVALNRAGNVMSVLQAEKDYLEEKIKNPYTTDVKYFFNALFNIVFNHKRSA